MLVALPAVGTTESARIIDPYLETHSPKESSDRGEQRATLNCAVVNLLRLADKSLSTNQDETRQCIERAIALLETEGDPIDFAERAGHSLRKPTLAPWQINRVISFIDSNVESTIRIRDLAAVARLSARHFSRAFRSVVGESPYAYVMRRRIERAQQIMLRTDTPLSQVALHCGLADQAHFTRLFRRIVGVSPGAWRRLNGKIELDSVVQRRLHHSIA
jgi:AraC family transcriptional regulator